MRNRWSDAEAAKCKDTLDLRVYTSNLLGQDDRLVLHGGGNTSVKERVGDEEILFVKGSGWDLSTIQREGFAPVKLDRLKEMATRESLTDSEMVRQQKEAMIDKSAPNPSVEAILHTIIPFRFVDHTHADAVVTISNSKRGEAIIEALYPDFLIVPYVMPGFILAKTIHEMSKNLDWEKCGGIILHHHGIFTFDDDAKRSYDKMIDAVQRAESYLDEHAPLQIPDTPKKPFDTEALQEIISREKGYPVTMQINNTPLARYYASLGKEAVSRGVLTPEHIIRTKRTPLYLEDAHIMEALEAYKADYIDYFDRFATDEICLNPAPNYAVIRDFGVVSFGKNEKEATVIDDIVTHTMEAVIRADKLGGYQSISESESFEMEYWELEQAKLKK
ncbi:MAG: oxidoreductase [Sulfurospirillum sp.]|nr:MAG: oxidoreductase [Sulfurospirillum sp.]